MVLRPSEALQKPPPPREPVQTMLARLHLPGLVQVPPPAREQVDLARPPEARLEPELIPEPDQREQGQQDVGVDEGAGVKGRQGRPALDEGQEDVGRQAEVGVPGVPQRHEGQRALGVALGPPRPAEADVDEGDGAPDEKGRDAAEVDNVRVGPAGAGAHVHHGQRAAEVGEDDGRDRHPAAVRPAQDPRRLAVPAHVQQRAGPDEDGRVARAEAGDQDEGVDQVHAARPARVLDRHRHRALDRPRVRPAAAADQRVRVGRAREAEEEGRAHVDEEDAPKHLSDRQRHRHPRVLGLGRRHRHRLDPGVKRRAEDKHLGHAPEPVREGAGVPPVPEPEGVLARDPSSGVAKGLLLARDIGQPELGLSKSLDAEELEPQEESLDELFHVVLVGQDAHPDDEVVPPERDAEALVDEAVRQPREGAARGVQRRELAEALHDAEGDDADDAEPDEQRRRPAVGERAARPDQQARPDDARQRHHAEVPRLEPPLDAAVRVKGREVAGVRRVRVVVVVPPVASEPAVAVAVARGCPDDGDAVVLVVGSIPRHGDDDEGGVAARTWKR
ncbi:hypothetical protein CTA1_1092 [Colletotrichum tanaceti]|uniref:Uncharacterized protein n=1 Tax=Colletotrichum tanaceti TaxID=1306861 RepID=A0A4U6X469_9PEZI|nr:hypothetical protein CTA1_1092 [Colletotrichum tanaceti]